MATTCKAVRWRTLPHFGRAIVNDRGEPRPPGCSLFGGSAASGNVVDVNSLPCGPPCNMYEEWGGAVICGRPPNASRVSHTSWSIQNSDSDCSQKSGVKGACQVTPDRHSGTQPLPRASVVR